MLSKYEERCVKGAIRMHVRSILTPQEVIGCLRQVVTTDNFSEVRPRLPDELAILLQDYLTQRPPLKAVGYWQCAPVNRPVENDRFPNPLFLVCPAWCSRERKRILAYLWAGRTYAQWRGVSYCRFACGIPRGEMGSRCLTDGEWVWPQGLPHYVEQHQVRLPAEFVAVMRRNHWRVPDIGDQADKAALGAPDVAFWIAWAKTPS